MLLERILAGQCLPLRPETAACLLAFHRETAERTRVRRLLATDPALLLAATRCYAEAGNRDIPSLEDLTAIALQGPFWSRVVATRSVVRLPRHSQPVLCRVWRYGLTVASLARRLAGIRHHEPGSRAYVAAWLQCSGLYAFAIHVPDAWEGVRRRAADRVDLRNRERELFGIDHLELAAHIAAREGIPQPGLDMSSGGPPVAGADGGESVRMDSILRRAWSLADVSPFRLTPPSGAAVVLDRKLEDALVQTVVSSERFLAEPRRDGADCCDWLSEGAKLAARAVAVHLNEQWTQGLSALECEPLLSLTEAGITLARAATVALGVECAVLVEPPGQAPWLVRWSPSGGQVLPIEQACEEGKLGEFWRKSPDLELGPRSIALANAPVCARILVGNASWLSDSLVQDVAQELGRAWRAYCCRRRAADLAAELAGERARQADEFNSAVERHVWLAVREFTAGAGHELNNRMGVIAGRAQMLLEEEEDEQRRRWLQQIAAEAMRVRELLERLFDCAEPPEPEIQQLAVKHLFRQVIKRLEDSHPGVQLRVRTELPPEPLNVWADPELTSDVLVELISNAIEHNDSGTEIVLAASKVEPAHTVIRVTDNGRGIACDQLPFVWVPFYCGRDAGRRPGIGLSLARRFIEVQGGTLRLVTGSGGTTAEILLPARVHGDRAELRCA